METPAEEVTPEGGWVLEDVGDVEDVGDLLSDLTRGRHAMHNAQLAMDNARFELQQARSEWRRCDGCRWRGHEHCG